MKEALEIASVILGSIGGGAAIIFGFSNWLGKIWAARLMAKETANYSRELESLKNQLLIENERHRVKLKKSEFIFQKEYEAASELVALRRSVMPSHSSPEMHLHSMCDQMARNFSEIETSIRSYMAKHGAVLKENESRNLSKCIGLAGREKFNVSELEVKSSANEAALAVLSILNETENSLLKQVHSQSVT